MEKVVSSFFQRIILSLSLDWIVGSCDFSNLTLSKRLPHTVVDRFPWHDDDLDHWMWTCVSDREPL